MPHIFDEEYAAMDRMRDFCQAPDTLHISLKPAEKKAYKLGNIDGEITLIKTETDMYSWGGCGNNLGTRIDIKLAYRQEGRSFEEEMSLGPQPQIIKKGPLRLVGAANEDSGATISVAL
jgi:hypothetical protein